MSTSGKIFKNTVALFISYVVYMGGSIVMVFYLSRLFQAEGLGSYSTAMAIFGLGELICELGLSNFIPRELAKDLSQTNRYLIHTGLLVLATTLVTIIGMTSAAPNLGYTNETVNGIYLIAGALLPTALRTVLVAIFICHQRAEFVTFTTLLWTTLRIVVSLYLLYQGYGISSVILVFTVSSFLSFFNSIFFYVKYIDKPRWEFDWPFMWKMLRELRAFVVLAIGSSIFAQAETVILSLIKGEAAVGFYSAAYKLITVWYMIPKSYMEVVFPVLSRAYQQSSQKLQSIQEKSIKYLLALALPLAIGGFAAAAPIINVFYGPGFESSILIFRIMAGHTILAFVNNVLWRTLLARGQQGLALWVQIISGIVRVGLSFLLIPAYGAVGAALALIGGYLIYTGMHVYYVQRGGNTIPFGRLAWRFTLAAVLMGGFTFVFAQKMNLFLLVLIAAAIYAGLVLLLRAFSPEDMALFSQIWRRSKQKETS